MKKFQFRLGSLVRLREAVRDERRQQLAEVVQLQAALAEEMQGLRQQLDEARHLHTAEQGTVNVDRLLNAERYEIVLLYQKKQLEQKQATVEAEAEKRRQALVWADQDVRVLEKLRDTQYQQWRVAAQRFDMQQLDEIAARQRPQEAAL